MSIEELTKRRNEYCKNTRPADWEAGIQNFMTEVINTLKEFDGRIFNIERKFKKKKEKYYANSKERQI